jgi:hypothetical protein
MEAPAAHAPRVFPRATSDDLPEFIAAEEGEAAPTRACRAPGDGLPYDPAEEEGPCFASLYQAEEEEGVGEGSIGGDELRHAFRAMHALIDRYHGNNTSDSDLVDAVHAFYEKNIRSAYDYGPWSRRSIWNYNNHYSHNSHDRQACDNIKMLYRQICFLRANAGQLNETTGEVTPNLRVLRELGNLLKLHSALCCEHRKRTAKT